MPLNPQWRDPQTSEPAAPGAGVAIGKLGALVRVDRTLAARTAELSGRHTLSAYGTAYVAGAERIGTALASCDERDVVSRELAQLSPALLTSQPGSRNAASRPPAAHNLPALAQCAATAPRPGVAVAKSEAAGTGAVGAPRRQPTGRRQDRGARGGPRGAGAPACRPPPSRWAASSARRTALTNAFQ